MIFVVVTGDVETEGEATTDTFTGVLPRMRLYLSAQLDSASDTDTLRHHNWAAEIADGLRAVRL